MLALLLVSARAEIVRATSNAVEVERTRGDGKVVQADAKGGKVRRLNLAFKEGLSLAATQFKVDVCLDATECSFAHAGLDSLQPFTDVGMPIGFRIPCVLPSEPARLQVDGQSVLVGDVVEPVPELMRCHAAESTIWFPDAEPLESGLHVRSTGDEIGYLRKEHRFHKERAGGFCVVNEVAECEEEGFGEHLPSSIPTIDRPQLADPQIAKVCLDFKGAEINPFGIPMPNQLVATDREDTQRITPEHTGNFATGHSNAPMEAGKRHPMRVLFQHSSALPSGFGDLPNPADSLLGQGCANGSKLPDREQFCTTSGLLSVVAKTVSWLTIGKG